MRKMKKNNTFLLICALLAAILTLSGCAETSAGDGKEAVTVDYVYAHPKEKAREDYVLNSATEEIVDDFSYLFNYPYTYFYNEDKEIKAQKYDDIVTIALGRDGGNYSMRWIYDAKRETVFFDKGPYKQGMPCYYRYSHQITDNDIKIKNSTFSAADVHNWKAYYPYPKKNTDHLSYFGELIIEYKGGVFEYHSGCFGNKKFPTDAFKQILELFDSFDYAENPLYDK